MCDNKCCYGKDKHIIRSEWEKCLKCNSTCPDPIKITSNNVLTPHPIHHSKRMNRSQLFKTNSNNTTSRWVSMCIKTYNKKMGIDEPIPVQPVPEEVHNEDCPDVPYDVPVVVDAPNFNVVVECSQNTIYNTPYGLSKYKPNLNCCNGFNLITPSKPGGQVYKTSGTRGGGLGDISYPRNQGGRWNTSTTNTKLYPVISKYKDSTSCSNMNASCVPLPLDNTLKISKQSGNIFHSTTNNMSKKQLYTYLSNNRAYLYR